MTQDQSMLDTGPTKVVIVGAGGRDFHNFNTVFRDDPSHQVVAFTAAQIPGIDRRRYPASLAGRLYPEGIPITAEAELPDLIERHDVSVVVFAYSDVSHLDVMHLASRVLAKGASVWLLGPTETMLRSQRPVISVCAVRTGAGKSPISRYIALRLKARGLRVAVMRHPMPYGDLARQAVQRFGSSEDLSTAETTIEEREEYEQYVDIGIPVFAGVDYARILAEVEKEADLIVWDGGNNDFPFVSPDLHIVVLDPLRAGHELAYHPGETNLRMADAFIVNKTGSATSQQIETVVANALAARPSAPIAKGDLTVHVESTRLRRGSRVAVVGDGPTLTHGGMSHGAGTVAAQQLGLEVVDPRPYAVGEVRAAFEAYPHLSTEVPALGYSPRQLTDLAATLEHIPADAILAATPIDLARLLKIGKPIVRVRYKFQESTAVLGPLLDQFVTRLSLLS